MEQQRNNSKWETVNTSNTENTSGMQPTESKDFKKVMTGNKNKTANMTKEMIMKLLESHTMKANVFGAMTTLIPDTQFEELAEDILRLIKPTK